jgi:predicted HNH restriction endonuclease
MSSAFELFTKTNEKLIQQGDSLAHDVMQAIEKLIEDEIFQSELVLKTDNPFIYQLKTEVRIPDVAFESMSETLKLYNFKLSCKANQRYYIAINDEPISEIKPDEADFWATFDSWSNGKKWRKRKIAISKLVGLETVVARKRILEMGLAIGQHKGEVGKIVTLVEYSSNSSLRDVFGKYFGKETVDIYHD